MRIRSVAVLALSLAALAACGTPRPAAPELSSYAVSYPDGSHAECLFQDWRVNGWTCLRERVTDARGYSHTVGYVN